MFTIVASRMIMSTVTAMTARASHRRGYGWPGVATPVERGVEWVTGSPSSSSAAEPIGTVAAWDHRVVPVSLVLTSDTHVPKRSRDLPHCLWTAIEAADVVVHAGDWVDAALLDELEECSRHLLAVHGNNDHGPLRERLPEVARAEIGGIRIAVVHETGDRKGREQRCAARFPDTDVLVFGHSHIPWDTTAPNGLRLINPGSPTDRRRQPYDTFVTAVAADGALHEVTFHPVPR